MTVAVSCNLSDGVILGVDSAATVPGPGGIAKIFENAEKLFQLETRPIGIAAYGIGALGARSIGSWLREFAVKDPAGVVNGESQVAEVAEALRLHLMNAYESTVVPAVEAASGRPFADTPVAQRPMLGLIVGGFSSGAYLSEVCEIQIPFHVNAGSASIMRGQGDFGANFFAMSGPILRYQNGYDQGLLVEILQYAQQLIGAPLSQAQAQDLMALFNKYPYRVHFAAMPMDVGVEYVRSLLDLTISHYRIVEGAPIVGGRAKIGKVTYRGEGFEFL